MAFNKKANECGWFYHAPARPVTSSEPVPAPLPSQIPGLSDIPDEEEKPRLTNLRDTDSKYIRLAKQGGRPDLLQMNQMPAPSKEAKGYPRCDWYYLEDNTASESEKTPSNQDYQFMLPEYMVHQAKQHIRDDTDYDGTGPNSRYSKRAPYAFDTINPFERDGDEATNKMTMKIPEAKKYGYGVRQGKNLPVKKNPVVTERVKPLITSQTSSMDIKQKYQPMPVTKDDTSGAMMSKLLSYGYERDWHDRVQRWQNKQDRATDTLAAMRSPDGPPPNFVKENRKFSANSGLDGKKSMSDEEKEPFKLSRFKNVPPRIDDHQRPELLKSAAVH